jgi:hypothetical protein
MRRSKKKIKKLISTGEDIIFGPDPMKSAVEIAILVQQGLMHSQTFYSPCSDPLSRPLSGSLKTEIPCQRYVLACTKNGHPSVPFFRALTHRRYLGRDQEHSRRQHASGSRCPYMDSKQLLKSWSLSVYAIL